MEIWITSTTNSVFVLCYILTCCCSFSPRFLQAKVLDIFDWIVNSQTKCVDTKYRQSALCNDIRSTTRGSLYKNQKQYLTPTYFAISEKQHFLKHSLSVIDKRFSQIHPDKFSIRIIIHVWIFNTDDLLYVII